MVGPINGDSDAGICGYRRHRLTETGAQPPSSVSGAMFA